MKMDENVSSFYRKMEGTIGRFYIFARKMPETNMEGETRE